MGLKPGFLTLSFARLIPFGNCGLNQSLTTGLWRRYEQKRDKSRGDERRPLPEEVRKGWLQYRQGSHVDGGL